MRARVSLSTVFALLLLLANGAFAQEPRAANYDEAKVGDYPLPDPLVLLSGEKVGDKAVWVEKRRPELLQLFQEHVYGFGATKPAGMTVDVTEPGTPVFNGKGIRRQARLQFGGENLASPHIDVLMYLPAGAKGKVPVTLGLNFCGNHGVDPDPAIPLEEGWMRNNPEQGVVDNKATEASRGCHASRWPIELALDRGYAVVTAYYGDIEPDHPEGWKSGFRAWFKPGSNYSQPEPITEMAPNAWGAIGAWGWGLSRILDYLEAEDAFEGTVDSKRVLLHGHSRLGKIALWAGALDERFAIVVSNNSGEGGAALARRNFGETTAIINHAFPHWFCDNFNHFSEHPETLPVDQHELLALMAPRPVYVASATNDLWADPRGEFLALRAADPVYALFGFKGLGVGEPPAADTSVGDRTAYHNRTGDHDITAYDWERYLDFADRHFDRTAR